MKFARRRFLWSSVGAAVCAATSRHLPAKDRHDISVSRLDKAAAAPVLKMASVKTAVKIASIELLGNGGLHFVRTTSTDGAVGIAVTNSRAGYLYPILQQLVIPYFRGKDARDLDWDPARREPSLIDGVYVYRSNYKLSGLALWCCVAWVEFSLLDLLGKMTGKPVGELLGGVIRREVPIYVASGRRDTTPEEEVALLSRRLEETGAKAVKFKVGGRMSNNADAFPGRTEGLVRLARKRLGDAITLYADANGSYDAHKAIEVGKLLEAHNVAFFEEPCPFDHLEETRRVAEALSIPIAGGEQETSLRRFRWMIQNGAVQIVQPDLHYNGGFIRAARVARMAAAAGIPITVHMSGGGVGYVDMLHFASCTPNIGKFQEYKGGISKSGIWYDPPLRLKNGAISVPTGPGLGITIEQKLVRDARSIISG